MLSRSQFLQMLCKKWNIGLGPKALDVIRLETQTSVTSVWSMDILLEIAKSPLPRTNEEVILVLLEMTCCRNSTTSASVWKTWKKDQRRNTVSPNPKALIDQPVEVELDTNRRIRTPVLIILPGIVPRVLIMEALVTIPRIVQKTNMLEQPRISK
jgi:hypothetical protein